MLEEIQAFALLGLIVGHYFLIRGCFGIRESLPRESGVISGKIDRTADLLDEMAQIISDFADGVAEAQSPPTQAIGGIPGLLSTRLMSNQQQAVEHAKKSEEWEVLQNDHPQTTKQAKD